LIGYVAKSKASHGDKNDAFQCRTTIVSKILMGRFEPHYQSMARECVWL
jgi:hypothetical protein